MENETKWEAYGNYHGGPCGGKCDCPFLPMQCVCVHLSERERERVRKRDCVGGGREGKESEGRKQKEIDKKGFCS